MYSRGQRAPAEISNEKVVSWDEFEWTSIYRERPRAGVEDGTMRRSCSDSLDEGGRSQQSHKTLNAFTVKVLMPGDLFFYPKSQQVPSSSQSHLVSLLCGRLRYRGG